MPRIVSNQPSPPGVYTKRFDKFSGVDFSNDITKISDSHSGNAKNLISDMGGHPEKRVGWRCLTTIEEKSINGIFALGDRYIVHAGDSMYLWLGGEDKPKLFESLGELNNAKSFGIVFCEKLWILTGNEFLCFDGEELKHVRDIATVPQVLSVCDTNLENGEVYQPFNLLTTKRCAGLQKQTLVNSITFPQNVKTRHYLEEVDEVWKDLYIPIVKVYYKESGEEIEENNGWAKSEGDEKWILSFAKTTDSGNTTQEDYRFNVDYPDAVLVEYDIDDEERREKNRRMIERCTFAAVYENRLFLGGNPDYPNTDFYSELNDGTYFADVNYTEICQNNESAEKEAVENREKNSVGTGGTKILGYSYVGNYLAIHKNGEGHGASIYLRSSSMTDNGMIFPIVAGINGESVISHHAIDTFVDDPLFITKSGVKAIASADITSERTIQSRSSKIDARLCNEKGLENACTCAFEQYFMVFINGNVYVADATLKTYVRNISNAFEYEWYFWDNVPARCVLSHNGSLFFGTEGGALCRFNTDMRSEHGGYLAKAYSDGEDPICAEWATPLSDFGEFEVLKSIQRRGSGIYVKNYAGCGRVKLLIRTERDFGEVNAEGGTGQFNFENIDFENFTFNTQPHGFIEFGRKVKKFRCAQVIVRNDTLNSPFGVLGVEFRYSKGYFAK